jgi:hypothetical protein
LRCIFEGAENSGVNFPGFTVLTKALLNGTGLPALSAVGLLVKAFEPPLELELIQTRMIQKPLLWVEVGKGACMLVGICELRLSPPARYDQQCPSLLDVLSASPTPISPLTKVLYYLLLSGWKRKKKSSNRK